MSAPPLWLLVHEDCELCELFLSAEDALRELIETIDGIPEWREKLRVQPVPLSFAHCWN
jgi:hypothetical protein